MFIRLKKIQGKHYAYHVANKRVRGKVKQKVKEYLGKAILPEKINSISFFEFVKSNLDSYEKPFKEVVEDLIKWELFNHGLDDVEVNVNRYTVSSNNSKIVIKLNEGYLYDKTLKDLIKFTVVGDDEYIIGQEFAEVFVKSGINIPKSLFVKLFEKIVR